MPRIARLRPYVLRLLVVMCLLGLAGLTAMAQKPTLVSIQARGSSGGEWESEKSSVNADGRFIVFESGANTLVPFDTNNTLDVFVRDLQTGVTALVSVNQTNTASGNGPSGNPVISADGRYVAFESRATDLAAAGTSISPRVDIFVRDMQAGVTTLVSVSNAGTVGANGNSIKPIISANGKVVSFESIASDLVVNDNNQQRDVFARDLGSGTTMLASVNHSGTGSGNNNSSGPGRESGDAFFRPGISAEGRVVVFESLATDLTTISDTNGRSDVFARDLLTGTTTLISVNPAGTASGNRESYHPTISANGQVVAFETHSINMVANDTGDGLDVLARNLQTNTTTLVSVTLAGTGTASNSTGNAALSPDGRFIAFQSGDRGLVSTDTNGGTLLTFVSDVFVRDMQLGTTTLVSINSAGTDSGNGTSVGPVMSADGRYVAFNSSSSDLDPNFPDTSSRVHIFLRDMQTGVTKLVSLNRAGTSVGAGDSNLSGMGADARFLSFESRANEFGTPRGGVRNVFALALNGQIQFSAADYTVGESGGTTTVTVVRNGGSSGPVTVNFGTRGGSASLESDYSSVSGTLNFAAGETSKSITIPVFDDSTDEDDETVNLFLSDVAGMPGSLSTAVLSIVDDDSPPSLSIGGVTVLEGDEGTVNALFKVSLSAPSGKTVNVGLSAANGSAFQFSDFHLGPNSLTFNPGETARDVLVMIVGDTTFEDDETFTISLNNPSNATIAIGQALGTIRNDDPVPAISVGDVALAEGNSGTRDAIFVVSLSNASSRQVILQYATADGTAAVGSDYTATSGSLSIPPGQLSGTVVVPIAGDTLNEASESFLMTITSPVNAGIARARALGLINNDDSPILLQFSSAAFSANEDGPGEAIITVNRSGDSSGEASVDYVTLNFTASDRSDYTLATGKLRFATGESVKTFTVFITNDTRVEGPEQLVLVLSNPNGTNGASLGAPAAASLTINSEDTAAQTPIPNPVDEAAFFVRQHYRDFLNREPDASGLAFWTNQITECGTDAGCREVRRINVSAAFFLSAEFQQTGFLVYRLHQASFGSGPLLRYRTFMRDTQEIGRGVVVLAPGWEEQLETNKQTFVNAFVGRPEFNADYPQAMSAAQFVDALNVNTGGALSQAERDALVGELTAGALTRGQVLRAVADDSDFRAKELNRAFVLMQYHGYLRRNPDDPPDRSLSGYDFWLAKLNNHGGNFQSAEMVKAFITSGEYRHRFGL